MTARKPTYDKSAALHQIWISKKKKKKKKGNEGNDHTIDIVNLMRGRERSKIGHQEDVVKELNRACLAARAETGGSELILLEDTGNPGDCWLLSAPVRAFA